MTEQIINDRRLNYYKIGSVIRKYRKERDLKLQDLSVLSGINSSLLSKIENGRMIPTIPTLFTLIDKLDIFPEVFFAQLSPDNDFPGWLFLPKELFTPYEKEEGAEGFRYFSILESNFDGGAFQVSLLHLDPGANRPLVSTAAFEFVYTLSGTLKYQLEDKVFDMRTGDALFFDGNIAHVPINVSNQPVILLVLYLFTDKGK